MPPWHGIDLDGTLAEYEDWQGFTIGRPVPSMVKKVRDWLDRGETVKIMTARAENGPVQIRLIHAWLKSIGLPALEVTNKKDHQMIDLYDDRVVTVETNTGKILTMGK